MKIYRTKQGIVVEHEGTFHGIEASSWDELVAREDLSSHLARLVKGSKVTALSAHDLPPPIGSQEVWAAGVTYYRSRDARMHESKDAGGGSFYDRVYAA